MSYSGTWLCFGAGGYMSSIVVSSHLFKMARSKVYVDSIHILFTPNLVIPDMFHRAQNIAASFVFQCMRI